MHSHHEIQYETHTKQVQEIFNLYENGQLNLEPGFQRQSVWNLSDRRRLIDSILRGYPLPSIFLYQRTEGGQFVNDVIDGKQRIETLLMFAGLIRGRRFDAKAQLPGEDAQEWLDWKSLVRRQSQHLITAYKLQCIELRGDMSDIIDLFVRINSTGKALTSAEKRHAKYFNSPFLIAAERLARKFRDYFATHGVFTEAQFDRMKDVELVCELMLAAHVEGVTNKKAALDKVMESTSLTAATAGRAAERVTRALKLVARILPNLKQTRFNQLADFYSLAVLVGQFDKQDHVLNERARNRLAGELLTAFSTGVDVIKLKQKQAQGAKPGEELYREYLLTVLEGTDSLPQRQRRSDILTGLLASLFERKDKNRVFSTEQRRVLWNNTGMKRCISVHCNRVLSWEDFTIDHIRPWSKGGRTALDNAALMCQSCNSAKGNR